MKIFSSRTLTPWCVCSISLLILTGCGSDSNPISPGNAQVTQLSTVNSQVPQNVFSSTLTGTAETPSVTSSGTGTGVVSVDPATNQMRATIVTADISGTQAHIHLGASGVAGPVVFSLVENQAGSGVWTTTATLNSEQLGQLTAGSFYFNVHTAAYPDGEIRGQILAQLPQSGAAINTTNSSSVTSTVGPDTSANVSGSSGGSTTASSTSSNGMSASATANRPLFYANVLSGSLVIPPNASTASAIGIVAYRSSTRNLTAVVVSRDIVGTGVNLRQATASATGPIVGSFTETSPGSSIWLLRASLTPPQAEALNNGGMYYELLSSAFPGGELRGQIVRTQGTTTPAAPVTPAAPTTTTTPVSATVPTTAVVSTTTPATVTPATTTPTPVPTITPITTTPTIPTSPTISAIQTPAITSATGNITPVSTTTPAMATTTPISTTAAAPATTITPSTTDNVGTADSSGTMTTSSTTSTTVSTTIPTSTPGTVTPATNTLSTQTSPSSVSTQ